MKQAVLVFIILCSISFYGHSQVKDANDSLANAYQIAKVLGKMKNNESYQDANAYKKIMGSLIWYANLQDEENPNEKDSLQNKQDRYYITLNNYISKWRGKLLTTEIIFSEKFNLEDIKNKINEFVNDEVAKRKLTNKIEIYYNLKSSANKYENDIDKAKTQLDSLFLKIGQLRINIEKFLISDSISKVSIEENYRKDTINQKNLDTLINQKNREIETLHAKISVKKDSIEIIKTETLKLFSAPFVYERLLLDLNNLIEIAFSKSSLILSSFESFTSSNITINNQKAADEQAKQSLNFQIPSQAQMIDALAIYLAKRVKQESVLWFFETITKNANKFELLRTFYPNTIGLLQSKEVYETPNMGTQWQYALSKDFVSLPENLFNSQWLIERVPENKKSYLDFLKATPKIASLITQRYNYNDLVRNMYLEYATKENENENTLTVKNVFTLLYAINNEMYTYNNTKRNGADSAGIRMLRYEDLRSMTKEEIEIMLSLIDMKYDGIFTKMLRLNNIDTFKITNAGQAEDIRKWIGRIQLGIEQLDKIRGEFIKQQELFEAGGKKDMAFSNYNIWLFLSELFKLVLPEKGSGWLSDKTIKASSAIKYIGQTQEIYNLISTKNFSGAVNTTIDLIDSLFYGGGTDFYTKGFEEIDSLVKDKYSTFTYLKNKMTAFGEKKSQISNLVKVLKNDSTFSKQELESLLNNAGLSKIFKADELDSIIKLNQSLSSSISKQKRDSIHAYRQKIISTITENLLGINFSESIISFKKNSQFAALLFEQNRHALVIIRKLGGFLNDAAFATTSKQLASVVESYAMPPGSYKRKRNSWYSVDLNAFVGPYVGIESVRSGATQTKNFDKKPSVYGFSAPIGISISKTFSCKLKPGDEIEKDEIKNPDRLKINKTSIRKKTKSTLTATVGIIDLGAVVSYRFNNTTDSILPQQFKWSQLFSPGFHLAYGIPSTPLVVQSGFQLTPQLRRVSEPIEQRQYGTTRFYIGLMFDIPLFNLWSRTRIVK